MAINLPANWPNSTPKAIYDILALNGGQDKLPVDTRLLGGFAALYALLQVAVHLLEHSFASSLAFGATSAALLGAATAATLISYQRRDILVQTLTALTATGALVALVSVFLHFVFAAALPPPLPTHRLVSFLLFPIAAWKVFAFAYIYRHARVRLVPAFALAAAIVVVEYWILADLIR
ncbi:MAG TPA: hypothetical protein VK446_14475 [Methylocystis sp.]|nr:hypothetical protein [Methylocystis sp.]